MSISFFQVPEFNRNYEHRLCGVRHTIGPGEYRGPVSGRWGAGYWRGPHPSPKTGFII